ncbi:MAG TPA: hypothetical protein VMZ92_14995 [Planctomycetota bacterium]|nr:hypothetical protein [Planctomycetota bacterium]
MAAKFPTTAPTVYTDKSTANDVGDTGHWDGTDANQVKAEIVAVAAKVGVDGDASPSSHDYKIAQLEARKEAKTGSGTLGTSTATTVTDADVTTSSVVLVQATSSAFQGLDPIPYVSAVNSGSFVLTHGDAGGSETFDYAVVT